MILKPTFGSNERLSEWTPPFEVNVQTFLSLSQLLQRFHHTGRLQSICIVCFLHPGLATFL